jgi:MoaA/NifB/PqqE/SkfB family radical SAM enzyme
MRFNNFWCYRRILFSKQFARTLWHSRRNVIADTRSRPPQAGPYMAEFDITYRCNCRCRMCQRWDDPRIESLGVDDYLRLAAEFEAMAVHQISIAGGEPLMRGDVFEIIDGFARHHLSVNLCTNGLLLDKYHDQLRRCGATCITVSLDGAAPATHDAIRGVDGSHDQIEKGLLRLLAVPAARRPVIRVRMTVSSMNQGEIAAFFDKWTGVADDVLLQPVHHCGDSYYTGLGDGELTLDPDLLAGQVARTPLARDGYLGTFIRSLRSSGAYPDFRCFAGVLMARIDPWGNVYPCLEQHVCVGSIKENTFRQVWDSTAFNAERERLRTRRTCRCWYNNTALIGHYGRLLQRTCPGLGAEQPRVQAACAQDHPAKCKTSF